MKKISSNSAIDNKTTPLVSVLLTLNGYGNAEGSLDITSYFPANIYLFKVSNGNIKK